MNCMIIPIRAVQEIEDSDARISLVIVPEEPDLLEEL